MKLNMRDQGPEPTKLDPHLANKVCYAYHLQRVCSDDPQFFQGNGPVSVANLLGRAEIFDVSVVEALDQEIMALAPILAANRSRELKPFRIASVTFTLI